MKIVLVFASFAVAAYGQLSGGNSDWYCNILKDEHCEQHIYEPRCGTDHVTYRNMCAFGKAHCQNDTINQLHVGPCDLMSSTRSPEQVIHGSEIAMDYQCVLLAHRVCEATLNEKLCGTDGVTYPTFCEYEKSRCQHRDLHVAKLGDCNA
ncbi:agrin-like [Mya arenaria]|uniref:agrin-like n=1 Tax=Mya arenaria TaxID=6604 RepID=UPI0022E0BBF0|nr:agrin-like [Mya arenaria]XP_052797773.1 agrin-like [Mya arenaria]